MAHRTVRYVVGTGEIPASQLARLYGLLPGEWLAENDYKLKGLNKSSMTFLSAQYGRTPQEELKMYDKVRTEIRKRREKE